MAVKRPADTFRKGQQGTKRPLLLEAPKSRLCVRSRVRTATTLHCYASLWRHLAALTSAWAWHCPRTLPFTPTPAVTHESLTEFGCQGVNRPVASEFVLLLVFDQTTFDGFPFDVGGSGYVRGLSHFWSEEAPFENGF